MVLCPVKPCTYVWGCCWSLTHLPGLWFFFVVMRNTTSSWFGGGPLVDLYDPSFVSGFHVMSALSLTWAVSCLRRTMYGCGGRALVRWCVCLCMCVHVCVCVMRCYAILTTATTVIYPVHTMSMQRSIEYKCRVCVNLYGVLIMWLTWC